MGNICKLNSGRFEIIETILNEQFFKFLQVHILSNREFY